MCYKYINLHIKCNVSSTCNISNLSSVSEYVGGLGQLFCFPRKIVEFPIHFCLVYFRLGKTCPSIGLVINYALHGGLKIRSLSAA
jgi:hypothetical protein